MELLEDKTKMKQIKRIQKEIMNIRPNYREYAAKSCWEINKRTIYRYWECK